MEIVSPRKVLVIVPSGVINANIISQKKVFEDTVQDGQPQKRKVHLSEENRKITYEQIEDLLLEAVNRALNEAKKAAAAETGKLFEGMMPPGLM